MDVNGAIAYAMAWCGAAGRVCPGGSARSGLLARTGRCLLVCLFLVAGCGRAAVLPPTPVPTPISTSALALPEEPALVGGLDMAVIYPGGDTELEMGQPAKFTFQVTDAQGGPVSDAQVAVTVHDAQDQALATVPAFHGGAGVYRTDYWPLPHRSPEGTWHLYAQATAGDAQASCTGGFEVRNSTSEILLARYGFWINAPDLREGVSWIGEEKGDARNGMVRWGGIALGATPMHFQASNDLVVHWREGGYALGDAGAVDRFLREEIGDLGWVRRIGPIQPFRFKHWDGWLVECLTNRPQETEWVIFYAPEMDKTYAISTQVWVPPAGLNPHGILRGSFEVFPEIDATGVAPKPLPRLLPGPELVSPPLAARFQGLEEEIILQWKPVKELAGDEYYEVAVDYYYREANPVVKFATRETQVTLPETLYRSPNCGVFNWRVTLKRQTRVGDDGQPRGEPLSYESLYSYVWWQYPPGERDFVPACPYTHRD